MLSCVILRMTQIACALMEAHASIGPC